jgi:hypothetical protein
MGISDDLHRESEAEHSGLPSTLAIIGACGARVERALRPIRARPQVPGETVATSCNPERFDPTSAALFLCRVAPPSLSRPSGELEKARAQSV